MTEWLVVCLFKVEVRKAGYKLICCLTELILQCYELVICLIIGMYLDYTQRKTKIITLPLLETTEQL